MLSSPRGELLRLMAVLCLCFTGCSDPPPRPLADASPPAAEASLPDGSAADTVAGDVLRADLIADRTSSARELGPGVDALVPAGPPRAFPGCQGSGCGATGGRGGKVIEVVNLNDSGAGSLRACVVAAGARTCVFRVGGTINLQSQLLISSPFITIAGQTAPGGGILLRGSTMSAGNNSPIMIKTHDVVIRYLRIRVGKNSLGTEFGDALSVRGNAGQQVANIVVDHVSLSWGTDENFEIWSQGAHIKNVTLSFLISSESLMPHSKGGIVGSHVSDARLNMTGIDIHHSYFAHNDARSPYVGVAQQYIVNNLIYNWGTEAGIMCRGGLSVDIVGNLTRPGLDSDKGSNPDDLQWYPYNSTTCEQSTYCISGNPSIYLQSNAGYVSGVLSDPNADNWPMLEGWSSTTGEFAVPTSYRRTTPLPAPAAPITLDAATGLAAVLLPTVGASRALDCKGAWVSARDSVDARVVKDYGAGTGKIISDEASVGGFPAIAGGTACPDTDHDGMPDAWEQLHQLQVGAADHNGDKNGDGYTNLEAYLGGIAP